MNIRKILVAILCGSLGCRDTSTTSPDLRSENSAQKLVVCPTSQSQTGTFVATPLLGGSLSFGGTSVIIPAGAVSLPTTFVLTIPASQYVEIEVHAVGLDSFLFSQPVTMTIDYSRCSTSNVETETLSAWHINSATKELLENMNGTDDKLTKSVTFSTGHLSGYALSY